MKKLLLTVVTACTILFAQAQCQANFSFTQNGPTNVFTDMSTINTGWSTNYTVSWEWDFGDGTISTQQNPVHTYANNGIYSPCLTVLYFDSVIINSCISVSCDSLFIGNSLPASWDCNPVNGCFDPGTGSGQYTSLSACQTACSVTASWECDQVNGCYDPGTGIGQYSSLSACQSVCSSVSTSPCDSLTITSTGGSMQTQLLVSLNSSGLPAYIDYWVTTSNDGTLLGEDSLATSHNVYNFNPISTLPYDTINTCLSYTMNTPSVITCCVTWIWNGSFWAKMGSVTSVGEINFDNKKLIKIVDVLGRETFPKNNEILFYIYEDGTIDKRYITTKNK